MKRITIAFMIIGLFLVTFVGAQVLGSLNTTVQREVRLMIEQDFGSISVDDIECVDGLCSANLYGAILYQDRDITFKKRIDSIHYADGQLRQAVEKWLLDYYLDRTRIDNRTYEGGRDIVITDRS